ncbi:hypothetical protein QAD02_014632 [Eretmocerus hayati]|uniref:Uncharacterized protein n=1 Tax=Eretmocerus hayati TaxID=131215 RepID=A0ACC2P627_9HYME|nr:hypothetical protein QAD02_014632 [Eretmocerus hayati]
MSNAPTTKAAVVSNHIIEIPRNDFQILFDVTNSEIDPVEDQMYSMPCEKISANQINSESIYVEATDNLSNDEMKEHLFEMPNELTSESSIVPFVEDTASVDTSNGVIFTKDSDVPNTDMPFGLEESSLGSHSLDEQTTNAGQNTKHMRTTANCESKSEDNCKAIARRFMQKELICPFTDTKSSGTKPIFKATGFFRCMLDSLTYVHTKDAKSSVDEHILGCYVGNLINSIRTSLGRAATAVLAPKTSDGQADDS